MKICKVSDNNFGLKITDNIVRQMVERYWVENFSRQAVHTSLQKIRNCVNDSFELTFKEFVFNKPCELTLRQKSAAPENFYLQFALTKAPEKNRGKNFAKPIVTSRLSPQKAAEIIVKKIEEYSAKISAK